MLSGGFLLVKVLVKGRQTKAAAFLIGPVPCEHIASREQSRVNRDERPSRWRLPLANIGRGRHTHRNRDRDTGGCVAGGVPRSSGKVVGSRHARRGIPDDGIGRIQNLGSQRRSIQEEPDAYDIYVIGRGGSHGSA